MISVCDDCEYTVLIADLIVTLSDLEKNGESFTLNIWTNGRDLPYPFGSTKCNFNFLQEGIRVESKRSVIYVWYDCMESIELVIK